MSFQIVVMPGSYRVDLPLLRAVAQEFGWTIQVAQDLEELAKARDRGRIGAVLFQEDSWDGGGSLLERISTLNSMLSSGRLVAFTEFRDPVDYPKLCRAGLYHALWLPLKRSEVRQCFGFISIAEKQAGAAPAGRPHLIARTAS